MSDFDTARRHVQLAAEYHDLPASKVSSLMTAFDIAARSSLDGGDVKFLDLHGKPLLDENYRDADVAAWLRYTLRVSPHLLAKPADTSETTELAPAKAPSSAAEYMQAVKAGQMSQDEAITAMHAMSGTASHYAPVPYRPNTTADLDPGSVSARMVAARNDPAAMAALNAALGLK